MHSPFTDACRVLLCWADTGGDRAVPKNRQFIGATLLTLTDSIIDDLTLLTGGQFPDVDYGVLVQAVAHNGPAYRLACVFQ